MSSPVLTIRLPAAIAARLETLAKKTQRPKAFYIKQLLEEHLADYEDAYLALDRLNDRNARFYTTEEVEPLLDV